MSYFQRLFVGSDLKFGAIELDARLVEEFTLSTRITEHPVDAGADITDHEIKESPRYVMEGVVTDSPGAVAAAASAVTNRVSSVFTGSQTTSKRSTAAFLSLLDMWQKGELLDVQTHMGLWENLAIENLTARVDNNTANMLRFRVQMRQVRLVHLTIQPAEQKADGNQQQSGSPIAQEGLKQPQVAEQNVTDSVAGLLV